MKPTRIAAIALLLAGSAAWSQPPDAPASADQPSQEPSPQQPPPEDAQDPQPADVQDDQQRAEPATDPQAEVQDDQQPAEPATDPHAADVASVQDDSRVGNGDLPEVHVELHGEFLLGHWQTSWRAGHICWPNGAELRFGGSHPTHDPSYVTYGYFDITLPGAPSARVYLTTPFISGYYRVGGARFVEFSTIPDAHGIRDSLRFRVTKFFDGIRVELLRRDYRGPEFQDPRYTFPGEGTPCHE
jgi:hypothetical protein